MNKAFYNRVKKLVLELVLLPIEERSIYLDRYCSGEPELRQLAENLLEHVDSTPEIMTKLSRREFWQIMPKSLADLSGADGIQDTPVRLGPYEIIDTLGHGGMGTVYRARQTSPVVRDVAIKVIRNSPDSQSVIARFEAERQTIATMSHPNIVTLFDAGENDAGRPYLVMEMVEGIPLIDFCNQRDLGVRERISLIIEICHGIEYAHQRGVIHRDLKPSNILVTEIQGRFVPKIIDFGISKILDGNKPRHLQEDGSGSQYGTVEYMSPEQLASGPSNIDSRSDLYSLGVMLFELLTGILPYDSRNKSSEDVLAIIRDHAPRQLERTTAWWQGLDDDIQAILDLTLAKDKDQRYQSVASLGGDLERYLASQPVIAKVHNSWYLAKKLIYRHSLASVFMAVIVIMLLGFGITMSVLFKDQVRLRSYAEMQHQKAETVNVFLQNMLSAVDPADQGPEVTVRELLDQASAEADTGLVDDPEIQASIRRTLGAAYLSLGMSEQAEAQLRRVLELQDDVPGPINEAILDSTRELIQVLFSRNAIGEAESLLVELIEFHKQYSSPDSLALATDLSSLGILRNRQGQRIEAERLLRRAIVLQRDGTDGESIELAESLDNLAFPLYRQGKTLKALESASEGLAMRRRLVGDDHPLVLHAMHNVAFLTRATGDAEQAAMVYREILEIGGRVLGVNHPELGPSLDNLARISLDQQRYSEADSLYQREFLIYETTFSEPHPKRALVRINRANALLGLCHYDEAEVLARGSVAMWIEFNGQATSQHAASQLVLGSILNAKGNTLEAETIFRDVLKFYRNEFPSGHSLTVRGLVSLSEFLTSNRRYEEAKRLGQEAVGSCRDKSGPGLLSLLRSLCSLACAESGLSEYEDAEKHFRDCLDISDNIRNGDHPATAQINAQLAEVLRLQGNLAEAESRYQSAILTTEAYLVPDHPRLAVQYNGLGEVMRDKKEYQEASTLFRRALAIQESRLPQGHWRTKLTRANLTALAGVR